MFSGRPTHSKYSREPLSVMGTVEQEQEGHQTVVRAKPAHGIDDLSASPWAGLHYRHEFLLHYQHELLE